MDNEFGHRRRDFSFVIEKKNIVIVILSILLIISYVSKYTTHINLNSKEDAVSYLIISDENENILPYSFVVDNKKQWVLSECTDINILSGTVDEVNGNDVIFSDKNKFSYVIQIDQKNQLKVDDRILVFASRTVSEVSPAKFDHEYGYIKLE